MDRLGIAFSGGANPAEIVDCVKLAESLGYESAWVAEGQGGDQFAVLSACAAQTSKILLGTSITSVFVRTVPTIAMAAATVDAISGGRFVLGVGSSHKVQVEPEHGVPYGKPLTRVRESVAVIRALLRDGRVSYQGETVHIEGFDLWFAPLRPVIPIYLSAVFPKMTALCGEIADGIILTRSTLATAAQVRERLAEGAERAGRDPEKIVVTSLLPTAVGLTREEALDALRPGLAFYAGFFPRYNRMMAEHGFGDEAAAIAAAWSHGDRQAAERAVSDALIEATSVAGTAERCGERIEAYRRSGIDLPILSPFARGPGAKARFEAVIRACAPSGGASETG
jgi:probable F420-dependent oxidoreductase